MDAGATQVRCDSLLIWSFQEIPLAHSFNEGQIEWFKAGSALNLVSRKIAMM